jgi:hypothetical protein
VVLRLLVFAVLLVLLMLLVLRLVQSCGEQLTVLAWACCWVGMPFFRRKHHARPHEDTPTHDATDACESDGQRRLRLAA